MLLPIELLIRLLAICFAIRDSEERITYCLLSDLAVMVPNVRKFLYDLTTLPKNEGIMAKLNPISGVLMRAIERLETEVLKIDKEALKKSVKEYRIHEARREIYKPFAQDTYDKTLQRIKEFKISFGYKWKQEISKKDKKIAEKGDKIYDFTSSSKALKFIKKIVEKGENLDLYVGIFSGVLKELLEYIEHKRVKLRAARPRYTYFCDKPLEEFVEEKIRKKEPSIINITGLCKSILEVPTVGREKVDLLLYLSYKSYRVRTYTEAYMKEVDPEKLKAHSLEVIGIPYLEESGEAIIAALSIKDKGRCHLQDD